MILTHLILFAFFDGAGGIVESAGRVAKRLRAKVSSRRRHKVAVRPKSARKITPLEPSARPAEDLPFTLPVQSAGEPFVAPFYGLDMTMSPFGLNLQVELDLARSIREREEEELIIQWAIG